MRAACLTGVRRIEVREKPEPRIEEPGDAIVAIELAGLCGSDLHPYRGAERGIDSGTTMGHELTGVIVEVGPDVRSRRVGEAVLSPFSTACGDCAPCDRGLSSRCRGGALLGWRHDGAGLEGAQATHIRIPFADATLVPRPSDVSPLEALLLGDVYTTGAWALARADVPRGEEVVVLGCGAVGLSAVLEARRRGLDVIAVDAVAERLRLAESLGARVVPLGDGAGGLRPAADLAAEVRALSTDEGAAGVVDAVGSEGATRLAAELLRPGGTLSIAGVHTEGAFAVTPPRAYDLNLTIRIGRCPVRSLLDRAIQDFRRDRPPIERLVTHRIPLAEASDAYRLFDERRDGCVKVVFQPS